MRRRGIAFSQLRQALKLVCQQKKRHHREQWSCNSNDLEAQLFYTLALVIINWTRVIRRGSVGSCDNSREFQVSFRSRRQINGT